MNLQSITSAAKGEKSMDLSKVIMFAPSGLSIILSLAIAFFIVWPKFSEVLELQKSNKTLSENATKLEEKAIALSSVDRSRLRGQLLAANQLVPSDKNIFNFIGQIEEIRNSTGVAITNLSVGTVGQFGSSKSSSTAVPTPPPAATAGTEGVEGASQVQMKLTMTSDYGSFLRFLDSAYSLPRVVIVKDASIAYSENQLNTSLTLNALWQELPTDLAPVETPLVRLTSAQEELLSKVETSGLSASPQVIPEVPKGREDIFSPFGN